MAPKEIIREADELASRLRHLQYEYYVLNKPGVSDQEYDRLFDRLLLIEQTYPHLKKDDSPTQRVGSDLESSLPEVEHSIPVLSLDKGYTLEAVENWMNKTAANAGMDLSFIVEEKIDGVSIVLYYSDGRLVRAVTRGNGTVGNDVTENIRTIGSVPLRLSDDETVAVRGEIYLSKPDFEIVNENQDISYANPRNLAAGTIRRLKSREAAAIPLQMFVYEGYFEEEIHTHLKIMERLGELGFRLNERVGYFTERDVGSTVKARHPGWIFGMFSALKGYIEKEERERAGLPYEIDGLVLKVNEMAARNTLGFTGHHPRWAIAYKFESPEAETRVISIDVQVGRTGRITPVARVEPVKIGGSTVSNVTLHNQLYIDLLELAVGDSVAVSKRGDVIPAVERVIEKNEDGNTTWRMPPACPSCSGLLQPSGAHLFCTNRYCPAQVKGKINFFIGKGQMDIENLGPETIDVLFDRGLIHGIDDLYTMNFESLIGLPGFGEKKVALIRKGIEKSKEQPFRIVLPSLGIPELGRKVAELIIEGGYGDIDSLLALADNHDTESLIRIHGIGEKTAERIVRELRKPDLRKTINSLRNQGLNFVEETTGNEPVEQVCKDQVWCVTGSFDTFNPRSLAMDEVRKRGGRTVSLVSGATTHLLAGKSAGSKLTKARELGVTIVTEEEFLKLLSRP